MKTIQHRLTSSSSKNENKAENVAKRFSSLMQHGKTNQALKLLSESSTNDLLKLSDETMNQLKHPAGEPSRRIYVTWSY